MSPSATSGTRHPSLRRTLLIFSLALIILPALFSTVVGAITGYRSSIQGVQNQLSAIAERKRDEIGQWVVERESDLAVLATESGLQQSLKTMHESPEDSPERLAAYSDIAVRLSSFLQKKVAFMELYLMHPETSEVEISTDVGHEGESYFLSTYFEKGREGVYLQPPVYDLTVKAPTMLIARPVTGPGGELMAVLVGRANLGRLGALLQSGTEEVFLVSKERRYLAGGEGAEAVPAGAISSAGIQAALKGEQGVGRFESYRGEEVLGAYQWLPELRVALLAERSWLQVVRAGRNTAFAMIGTTVMAAALASGAALILTRRIVSPIANLTEAATQIASGDLERTAPVQRADEIGRLAEAFNAMTAQLRGLIGQLEQRVGERTRDLQRRTVQLEAAAEVARDAATIRDLGQLLDETVHLISEEFGFYHAGIFLLDEPKRYAILQAASSEGGKRMLQRGHKLEVGRVGIVGHVAQVSEARIALDVGEDAVFFENPDLPDTRSEMALPLSVRGEVVGVLDVQSTEGSAFTDEDVGILQTMADQVAVAIDNARLLDESQRTLRELEKLYGQRAQEAWREEAARRLAYRYTGVEVEAVPPSNTLDREILASHSESAVASERDRDERRMVAPIRLRGQDIGSIVLRQDVEEEPWSPGEVALMEKVSTQIALALENARLLEATQRRAAREQLTRKITDKMRRAPGVERMVQTAVDELYDALGISRAFVRLAPPSPPQDDGGPERE